MVVVSTSRSVGARNSQKADAFSPTNTECKTKNKEKTQFREEKKGMLLRLGMKDYHCNKPKEIVTEVFGLSKADREEHEKWINSQRGIPVSQINF